MTIKYTYILFLLFAYVYVCMCVCMYACFLQCFGNGYKVFTGYKQMIYIVQVHLAYIFNHRYHLV